MWRSAAPDVDIVCHVRVEWIFRELSAAIMRCIPKEKNREEEITCSVLHFEKIRAVHPSVFRVENAKHTARSTLRSARNWKMQRQNLRTWSTKSWKPESSYWSCGNYIGKQKGHSSYPEYRKELCPFNFTVIFKFVLVCAPVLQRWQQPSLLYKQQNT